MENPKPKTAKGLLDFFLAHLGTTKPKEPSPFAEAALPPHPLLAAGPAEKNEPATDLLELEASLNQPHYPPDFKLCIHAHHIPCSHATGKLWLAVVFAVTASALSKMAKPFCSVSNYLHLTLHFGHPASAGHVAAIMWATKKETGAYLKEFTFFLPDPLAGPHAPMQEAVLLAAESLMEKLNTPPISSFPPSKISIPKISGVPMEAKNHYSGVMVNCPMFSSAATVPPAANHWENPDPWWSKSLSGDSPLKPQKKAFKESPLPCLGVVLRDKPAGGHPALLASAAH